MKDSALEEALRNWGAAKKKAQGTPAYPRSIFGRINDEGSVGAAIRGQTPDPPEVMLNDALLIARAIRASIDAKTLKYNDNQVLHEHYTKWGPLSKKIERLKLKRSDYFTRLNRAKSAIGPYFYSLTVAVSA